MRLTRADLAYQIFIYCFVGILVLCSLFPLLYVAGLSFTSEAEYIERGNLMVIPYQPTLNGYKNILFKTNTYVIGFGVSVMRTVIGTLFTLTCTLSMGYILSKRDMPGHTVFTILVLITILYGGGLIPTFLTVKALGLLDSFWSMIIPGLIDSWGVLVFRQFFLNLPREVEDSAEIDGCGQLRLLTQIVIPMSLPVIAALGLFSAVGHWNQWFDAMIYIQTKKELFPLQLLLKNLFNNANIGFDTNGNQQFSANMVTQTPTSIRMVVTMVGTVPILCIYPFLQKYFVKGVYCGAVKG